MNILICVYAAQMGTIDAASAINEAKKFGMVLLHDPSRSKNRCFYQCLTFHLGLDVHEVITRLEAFMTENQFLFIENEVCTFLITYDC